MGSKKQTIGHHYLMSMLSGLWRGPIDALLAFKVGDKLAWQGKATNSNLLTVNMPNLFGGEKKEGGIQGAFRVFMGDATQILPGAGAYSVGSPVGSGTLPDVQTIIGGRVSEFRGVVTFWYDGLVTSMNPYPKEWKFKGRRTTKGWHDDAPWYPAKCPISMGKITGEHAIYLALDTSSSMAGTKLATLKTAVNGFLDALGAHVSTASLDIRIVAWSASSSSIERRNCDAADITALKSFVTGMGTSGGTDFEVGVASAPTFFSGSSSGATRTMAFVTDGEPFPSSSVAAAVSVLSGIASLAVFGFNIDLEDTQYTEQLDNTPDDGVPVIEGSNPDAMLSALQSILVGEIVGFNPAHMIYQAITDPEWGRGMDPSFIDAAGSFTYSADTFYNEGFGLCLTWFRKEEVEDFIQTVLDHAGAALYTDRQTGLLTLRPIRADYDPAELPVFDLDSGLIDIIEDDSAASETSYNEVIVTGHDPLTDQDFEMRAQNPAAWQENGAANSLAVTYRGVPTQALAGRIAGRELKVHASGLKKFRVILDRRAWRIAPASCFIIQAPHRGIASVILRAGEIEDGSITSGEITIRATEDVFGMPDTSFIEPVDSTWTPPNLIAEPATVARLMEAGYRDVYQSLGKADAEALDETDAAILEIAVAPTSLSLEYDLYTKAEGESDYENRSLGYFTGGALLAENVTPLQTEILVSDLVDFSESNVGQAVLVNDELMVLEAFDTGTSTITVGRGVGDTIPTSHLDGDRLWTIDDDAVGDDRLYVAGETAYAKVVTKTSSDSLALAFAPEQSIELVGRPFRPYPPADVRIDGESIYTASQTSVRVDPVLSWVHRNRLVQADNLVSHTDPAVSPEDGTTYNIKVYDADGTTLLRDEETALVDNWTYTGAMQSADNPVGPFVYFDLATKRDGVLSYSLYRIKATLRFVGDFVLDDSTDNLITESGDNLIYE